MRISFFFFFLLSHFVSCFSAPAEPVPLKIPMRDGLELPADLYLPTQEARSLPCILIRTPNGKAAHRQEYAPLAELGYAVVIQDMRSTLDEKGRTFPFLADAWGDLQDGHDTIQWLAGSPYTNGAIGTAGVSARGIAQFMLAPTHPAALKCQHIGFATANLYEAIFEGGVLQKNTVEGWLKLYAKDPSVLKFVTSRPQYDAFWTQLNSLPLAPEIHAPSLLYAGWYDLFLKGILDAFVSRQEKGGNGAKGTQKLIIGPWTHHWPRSSQLGDFSVPEKGRLPPLSLALQPWFDYYLKGISNGLDKAAPVTYYTMGPLDGSSSAGNLWQTAETWPVPAEKVSLYFTHPHGLALKPENAPSLTLPLSYDPQDPVPTLGGRNLFIEAGPKDQRPIEERKDVLVFTTPPLEVDLEVTGPLSAEVYFSSAIPGATLAVRLTDVYPDGRSILISEGIQSVQNAQTSPIPVVIDLCATSQIFAKGHRIRLSLAGSNYPKFELSPLQKTSYTIFSGIETPSRLILPIPKS